MSSFRDPDTAAYFDRRVSDIDPGDVATQNGHDTGSKGPPRGSQPPKHGKPAEPRYELLWLKDALVPQDPPKNVVSGVFLEGSLNLFVGMYGSKKTWVLADAALAVAMGERWLGEETLQGPSLIIDEESGPRRLGRRIAALARARGAAEDTPLAYVSLAQFDIRKPEDVQEVRRVIEEVGAVLVVIDAMVDIMPGADENAVSDVQPAMMALRKIAEETRAAVVLIHHTNRGGSFRGSSSIPGAVDLMLKVESKSGSSTIEIKSEKTRDLEPFEMAGHIRFEGDPLKVYLDPAEVHDRGPRYNSGEEYVMRYLNEHGASTVNDIQDHADTCAPGTARKGIYSLASRKKIERVDDGGSGTEAVYDIWRPKDESYRLPYKD